MTRRAGLKKYRYLKKTRKKAGHQRICRSESIKYKIYETEIYIRYTSSNLSLTILLALLKISSNSYVYHKTYGDMLAEFLVHDGLIYKTSLSQINVRYCINIKLFNQIKGKFVYPYLT